MKQDPAFLLKILHFPVTSLHVLIKNFFARRGWGYLKSRKKEAVVDSEPRSPTPICNHNRNQNQSNYCNRPQPCCQLAYCQVIALWQGNTNLWSFNIVHHLSLDDVVICLSSDSRSTNFLTSQLSLVFIPDVVKSCNYIADINFEFLFAAVC